MIVRGATNGPVSDLAHLIRMLRRLLMIVIEDLFQEEAFCRWSAHGYLRTGLKQTLAGVVEHPR